MPSNRSAWLLRIRGSVHSTLRRRNFSTHLLIVLAVTSLLVNYFNYLKQIRLEGQREFLQQLFVYQSFYYPNSSTWVYRFLQQYTHACNYSFGTTGHDTVVTLMAADVDYPLDSLLCIQTGSNSTTDVIATRVETVPYCRLRVFVLVCSLPPAFNASNSPTMGIYFKYLRHPLKQNVALVENLNPLIPSRARRRLVVCASRIFAFENWPLLLTAMEVYRQMGVDLVVTHIRSVLTTVYQLMLAYERDGLLAIRSGLEFPYDSASMPYNPNWQTDFSNQLPMAHECFYEFREAADFIALLDWDDVLMSTAIGGLNLYSILAAEMAANPLTAYFNVRRVETTVAEPNTSPDTYSVSNAVRSFMPQRYEKDPKMVVVPSRVTGFWIHSTPHTLQGYGAVDLPVERALIYHLNSGGSTHRGVAGSRFPWPALDLNVLEAAYRNFSSQPDMQQV